MNERILELAEQADAFADAMDIGGKNWIDLRDEYFTELIVRECIDICKKQEYEYWRSSEEQEFTPIDCADRIKQHFGVKE